MIQCVRVLELNLHRTLTLQRVMREPPLLRALMLYSSISSGVTLLITRMHLSPSRVRLYLRLSDSSLVPLYLDRRGSREVPFDGCERCGRRLTIRCRFGPAGDFGFETQCFAFVAFGVFEFFQELRWRRGIGILHLWSETSRKRSLVPVAFTLVSFDDSDGVPRPASFSAITRNSYT